MFIASFTTPVNPEQFTTDKNGNLPLIGNVCCGEYHTSIINGTVFKKQGYKEGALYLCKNTPALDENGTRILTTNQTTGVKTPAWNVEIIAPCSIIDLVTSEATLGAAKRLVSKALSGSSAPVVTTEPVLQDDDDTI